MHAWLEIRSLRTRILSSANAVVRVRWEFGGATNLPATAAAADTLWSSFRPDTCVLLSSLLCVYMISYCNTPANNNRVSSEAQRTYYIRYIIIYLYAHGFRARVAIPIDTECLLQIRITISTHVNLRSFRIALITDVTETFDNVPV